MPPTDRAFQGGKGRIAWINREQVADGGDVGLQLPHTPHALLDLGNDLRLPIPLVNLKILPQQLNQRQERTRLAKGDAVALQPGHGFARVRQRAGEIPAPGAISLYPPRPRCLPPAPAWP